MSDQTKNAPEHLKGPWSFVLATASRVTWHLKSALGYTLASFYSVDAVKLAAAAPDLLAALQEGLHLKGGWREAIVELEDHCSEPVRLKNMLAAADQLDAWAAKARAALAKASEGSA